MVSNHFYPPSVAGYPAVFRIQWARLSLPRRAARYHFPVELVCREDSDPTLSLCVRGGLWTPKLRTRFPEIIPNWLGKRFPTGRWLNLLPFWCDMGGARLSSGLVWLIGELRYNHCCGDRSGCLWRRILNHQGRPVTQGAVVASGNGKETPKCNPTTSGLSVSLYREPAGNLGLWGPLWVAVAEESMALSLLGEPGHTHWR